MPLRALELTGEDLKRLRGFQFLSAKPLLLVINLDEADLSDVGSAVEKAADKSGLTGLSRMRRPEQSRCAQRSSSRLRNSRATMPRRSCSISG